MKWKPWQRKIPEPVEVVSPHERSRTAVFEGAPPRRDNMGGVKAQSGMGTWMPTTHAPMAVDPLEPPNFESFKAMLPSVATVDGNELKVMTYDEAMTSFSLDSTQLKELFTSSQGAIPEALFLWYSSQSFIGYQTCAIVSQQWLVNRALSLPPIDAVRNGYEIATTDEDSEINSKRLADLIRADERFKIPENLVEFGTNVRRFGFRIAIFVVESDDPRYYEKPFNIDGVRPGSYKGITQIDPQWVAPILDKQAAANPAAMDFYEPTWWQISGQLYHKSHLIIHRYMNPPDIIKPAYQYGGIPLTQLILERVYAAERTANEAPMLVQTKRLNVLYTDVAEAILQPDKFIEKLAQWIGFQNNYGVKVAGTDDKVEQFDTSLTDLENVIKTQYELVAAVAGVPATKLMALTPQGFNATGEFEMKNYHELLESEQSSYRPLIKRHHELFIKSELEGDFEVTIVWNSVSSPTFKELAEVQLIQAQRDNALVLTGAIDADDVRTRLIRDADSGYTGIEAFEDLDTDDDGFESLTPEGGEAESVEDPTVSEESLAAGQIMNLTDIVIKVSEGSLPKPAAREILLVSFPMKPEEADKILASIVEGSTEPELPPALGGAPGEGAAEETEETEETATEPPATEDAKVLGYVSIRARAEDETALQDWVTCAGISQGTRPGELHVTVAHSSDGIPGYEPTPTRRYNMRFTGVGLLGDDPKALVLFASNASLQKRHKELIAMGAVHNFDEFLPHVTVKYDPVPGDLELLQAAFSQDKPKSVRFTNERINLA